MSDGLTNSALRADVREDILAAADAVYRRGGVDAVTLSAVAREANLARGVIYAHFASRADLIAAVVPAEPAVEKQPTDETAAEAENYDALMRAQADALQELSKQVIVPKPRTTTDQALARLDARLCVAEKSLAALDQKMGERLKGLDVETGALAERLHGLRQRLEKFEEKQMTALAQLRLDVHNLHHSEPEPRREPVLPADPVEIAEPEAEAEADAAAPVAEPSERVEPDVRLADYLVSARRAANDAAERRAAMPVKRKPVWMRFLGKRRWAILAAAAALVAWFDIYVFAHYQPAQGAIVERPAPVAVPKITAKPEWSPRAQLVRGLKYLNGSGVPVDVEQGRLWIERAALKGQPVAQNLMGVIYQTGAGVDANLPVAIGWYEGAAKQGNVKAMTNLGKLYAGGWEEGTDYTKAAEWFAKAAGFGEVDAAFDLAILYERGLGVVKSLPQAYRWYAIAAVLGDKNAGIRAVTLSSDLTPEEREAADAAVAAFKPAPVDTAANETPKASG